MELQDGTRTNSQARVQNEINLYNQEKRAIICKSNGNGAMNLIKTTLSTSFTWPATFGRRHHSPPLYAFCEDSIQMLLFLGTPKIESQKLQFLFSPNFGRSYISPIKFIYFFK